MRVGRECVKGVRVGTKGVCWVRVGRKRVCVSGKETRDSICGARVCVWGENGAREIVWGESGKRESESA